MSFGIACSDNTSHIKTEETLLLEADSALYHAKTKVEIVYVSHKKI